MTLPDFVAAADSVPGPFLPCIETANKSPAARRKSPDDPETDRPLHKARTDRVPVRRSRLGRRVIEGPSTEHATERQIDRRRPDQIGGRMVPGTFGIRSKRVGGPVDLASLAVSQM